jgi:AP2 domain
MAERAVNDSHYLSWVNNPGARVVGWLIRVPYTKEGKRMVWRKVLSVARHGGTKERLKIKAVKLRDEMMQRLQVYDPGLGMFHRNRSNRNTSGVVGVRKSRYEKKGRRQAIEFWEARWKTADGKIGRKVFSIARYGSDCAKELAILARAEALKERGKEAKEQQPQTGRKKRSVLKNGPGAFPD